MSDAKQRRAMIVKDVLETSGLTRAQIARDSGLSQDAIWAWVKDRRVPGPDSLLKLADGLERRSGELQALVDQLRKAASE